MIGWVEQPCTVPAASPTLEDLPATRGQVAETSRSLDRDEQHQGAQQAREYAEHERRRLRDTWGTAA